MLQLKYGKKLTQWTMHRPWVAGAHTVQYSGTSPSQSCFQSSEFASCGAQRLLQ